MLTLLALLVACSGDEDDTDPQPTDTDDTDTDPGPPVMVELFLYGDDGDAVEGAAVTIGADTQTTDADGLAAFELAQQTVFEARAVAAGYPDLYLNGSAGDVGGSWGRSLVSTGRIELLYGLFEVEHDTTKGIVSVNAVTDNGDGTYSPLTGGTVDLSVAYDMAAHSDAAEFGGYAEGNTVTSDTSGYVIFANVPAGAFAVTVTPPSAATCTMTTHGPEVAGLSFTSYAGAATTLSVVCN